jgi:hypothetical protein
VLVTEDCPTDHELLDRYAAQAHEGDPDQRVTRRALGGSADELREAVAGADLVLHVSDRPVLARARDLDRLCREHERPLIQGIVVQDQAWTGPVGGAAGAGWESAWQRVWSNLPRQAGADPFPAEPADESPFLAGPTASIVGNRVGFLAFQYVTGVAAARAGVSPSESLTIVDLETLDTTEHSFLAHPATTPAAPETEAEAAQRFAGMLEWQAPEPGAFSKAAAELFDARVGPMRSLDEADLTQLPLHLAEVSVADPFGWLDTRDGHPTALGLGDGFGSARHDGALRAFELYATLAVDPRRLVNGEGVFARDLATGAWELIDARLAYPVLSGSGHAQTSTRTADLEGSGPAPIFTRPVGLAAAPSGAEALRQGLLLHCAALAADAVSRRGNADPAAGVGGASRDEGAFAELALDAVELSGAAALYRDAARTAMPRLQAYDLSTVCGVPVLAWCDGETTLAYTAGGDLAEAVTAGLLQALLHYQAAESGQTRLAPPAPPPLPAALRGEPAEDTTSVAPPKDWQDLVATLTARGHRVHALAVGHDRLVAQVLPTVVQVVLR